MSIPFASTNSLNQQATATYNDSIDTNSRYVDRMFLVLMGIQWIAGIVTALVISPRTWIGNTSYVHLHIWAAVILGGVIASMPCVLVLMRPGAAITRYVIAIAQMSFSILLIHLSGGRIEAHFHIFGSLAFLAFYRDIRVLLIATAITAVDHAFRGAYWPESVFGVFTAAHWRWMEHTAWVLFEDTFLFIGIRRSLIEMRTMASQYTQLRTARDHIANEEHLRTLQLKESLTDRNELLAALNKSAIVSVTNTSGIITYANDKFCELSGYSRDELLGQDHRIINSGAHAKQFWTEMYRVAISGQTWRAEVKNRAKDGSIYWVDSSVRAVLDAEGKLKEFVAVRVDITERKAQEQELQRTNKDLNRAKINAEAANKAKSLFLANMSHEIRTPMTAILGHIDLMLEPNQPDQDRLESVEVIHRNADYLMTLIGDVLDLSKIEASELDLEETLSSPASIAEDVMSLLRPRAHEKGLQFTVEYDTPIPRNILTDPYRLRQILLNLTTNAIKFTHEGTVTLRVALDDPDSPVPMLRFCVCDSGIGISADQINHIFKPFSQADTSTTRKFGGTGLGLAISTRLASALGGSIEVHSKPGQGSVFSLRLPVKSDCTLELVEGSCRRDQPRSRPTVASPTFDGHILLVEDGPDNQRLLAHHLRRAGAKVELADNGKIAVEAIQAAPRAFDLILMDMQMPVMDGYEATRMLRNQGVTTPIVALTAHSMSGDRQRCLDAGCDDYLTKPIDRKTLIESCAQWLSKMHQHRAA